MIIYNVTIKVQHDAVDAWVKWMKEVHVHDVLQTGAFTDARLCRLLEHDDEEGVTFSAQYTCDSMDEYHTYINDHATEMRQRGFDAFGNKFVAFRTVMEVL